MPWTAGDAPVTIERLFGFVKLGTTDRATRYTPSSRKRARAGVTRSASPRSKYSGSDPSMQTTTTGQRGARYSRPLTTTVAAELMGATDTTARRPLTKGRFRLGAERRRGDGPTAATAGHAPPPVPPPDAQQDSERARVPVGV